jgi:hypothetical protein
MDFPRNSLNISNVLNLPFVQNLYGYLLSCVNVIPLLDFAECALSKSFIDSVVSNHLMSILLEYVNLEVFLF